jgi:hypothetical protein
VLFSTTADPPDDSQVSEALRAAQAGDQEAAARLLSRVYAELRRLTPARGTRQPPGQTLQATALVHEACLSLVSPCSCPNTPRAARRP